MPKIESDIRRWLGDGKTFVGRGEHDLVRQIVGSYQASRAATIEEMESLQTMAHVTGFDGDVRRMLGASICEADGGRTLHLEPKP